MYRGVGDPANWQAGGLPHKAKVIFRSCIWRISHCSNLAGIARGQTCYYSFMNLDDTQRQQVKVWINEGLKLSEIQTRLEKEHGLRMTYLDVRLLVDELKLMPKDPMPTPSDQKTAIQPPPTNPLNVEPEPKLGGKVRVDVDQIARSGAVASGKVTFSDGKSATWFLDETGRLGIGATEKGYKPPEGDLQEFQLALQRELQKLGY